MSQNFFSQRLGFFSVQVRHLLDRENRFSLSLRLTPTEAISNMTSDNLSKIRDYSKGEKNVLEVEAASPTTFIETIRV